jgi:hypothetical protein
LPPEADPTSWSNVSVQNENLTAYQQQYGTHIQLNKGCEYTGGAGFGYVNAMDGCNGEELCTVSGLHHGFCHQIKRQIPLIRSHLLG